MENSWATKAICGDFFRPPPPWAEEISGHRSPAVVRRTFPARPLFGRIGPYFRGKPRQTECTKFLPPTRALARTRTQHSTLCTSARLHARARIGKLRGAL